MKDNFCITNEYSIIRKGSFTIETACVMPLILLVLMGLIYLSFFVHNRAWLTAAAYESAVSGSMEGKYMILQGCAVRSWGVLAFSGRRI